MLSYLVNAGLFTSLVASVLCVASNAAAEAPMQLARPALLLVSAPAQRVRLVCAKQRCPQLRVSQRWLVALPPVAVGTVAAAAVAGSAASVQAPGSVSAAAPTTAAFSVGARVTLRSGRELSLQLTPTPARCAPLFSLRY